jgi:Tfp pilus assembly PilM family ATPase
MQAPLLADRTPLGLDFTGRALCAVQMRRAHGRWRIETAASAPRRDPSAPLAAEEVARFVDVLRRQGFAGRTTVLAVPPGRVMNDMLTIPASTTDEQRPRLARDEIARSHRCDPESIECSAWELPRRDRSGALRMMAVACPRAQTGALLDTIERCGLTVTGLDVTAWALARAGRPLLPTSGLGAILDLGWDRATLVVLCGGTVVYERGVPEAGLAALVASVGQGFELPADMSEHLVREIGAGASTPPADVDPRLLDQVRAAVTAHVDALQPVIRNSFSYADQEYPDRPIDRLLLTGEGADVPAVDEHLARANGVETRVLTPSEVAECPPGRPAGASPALCTALGLALHGRTS